MNAKLITALGLLLVLSANTSLGQGVGDTPVVMEGPIKKIVLNNPSKATLTVMGVKVIVNSRTFLTTAITTLTLAQLVDPTTFPGRTKPGFIGGSASIEALRKPSGRIVATRCSVSPGSGESVLLGEVTRNTWAPTNVEGDFEILGTEVVMVTDDRIPCVMSNSRGFPVDLSTVPVGGSDSLAVGHGWFGRDGVFYCFRLETRHGTVLSDNAPDGGGSARSPIGNPWGGPAGNHVSIIGARCSRVFFDVDVDEVLELPTFRVRGFSSSDTGTVGIYDPDKAPTGSSINPSTDPGKLLGTALVVPLDRVPGLGRYRFEKRFPVGSKFCKIRNVLVKHMTNGSTFEDFVD